jgi:hypothetical protein
MTNTAPNHTEDGMLHPGEGGMEITQPDKSPVNTATTLPQVEEKMDVDIQVEAPVPVEDVGLVMGEMEPPVEEKALVVDGQDGAKEVEAPVQTNEIGAVGDVDAETQVVSEAGKEEEGDVAPVQST